MCIDCGCYGTVTPYGVGGRTPTELPKAPDVSKYNKPIIRIGETPMMKMDEYKEDMD
jgi:hypothetical protein